MDADKEDSPEVIQVKEYINKEIKGEALKDVKVSGEAKWMDHTH
jgi:hypothetical protein